MDFGRLPNARSGGQRKPLPVTILTHIAPVEQGAEQLASDVDNELPMWITCLVFCFIHTTPTGYPQVLGDTECLENPELWISK